MAHLKRRSLHTLNVPAYMIPEPVSEWSDSPISHESSGDASEFTMDQFFENNNLFRYHLPVDGSCLFRAVSETLFGCQTKHAMIREAYCDYVLKNKKQLKGDFDGTHKTGEGVRDIQTPGWTSEMHILSKMYKVDFLVYYLPEAAPKDVTRGNHETKIQLCWTHNKQYDLVYTKQHIEALRVTQAIVYDVLYKDVFELGSNEVDFAVNQMLYEKDNFKNKRHLTFTQWCNSVIEGEEKDVPQLPENKGEQIVLAVRCGVPPFPFKVAKCLDPRILRNVEYLNWCEEKRDAFRTGNLFTPALDSGVKCVVRYGLKEHTGFVQSIDRKSESAEVFLQNLGAVHTIPLSNIESTPVKKDLRPGRDEDELGKIKAYTSTPLKTRRSFSTGDAITRDQSRALNERYNHAGKITRERQLREIPETPDYKPHTHDDVYREGRKHGRKNSLPAAHFTPITSSPQPTYVQASPPIAMIPTQMSPLIVDASGHYHLGVSPPTEASLYSPPGHFMNTTPESYPIMGTVPVVPLAQFNPSVPPPTFTTVSNEMDSPEEMIDCRFPFPGPPIGLDVSTVAKSERADGSDLPRMEILRYFFNLGVSAYRSRKSPDLSIRDDSLLQQSTANASFSMPSPITGYSIVPQHSVVYQPNYQQFYSLVPSQQQTSFTEVPTFQMGPVMAAKTL